MSDKLSEGELLRWLEKIMESGEYQDNDEQAYQQIVALIKKPKITDEWYDEKARGLWIQLDVAYENYIKIIKDFIRSLVEEVVRK